MRYVKAKWQISQQELIYRIYITDSLYAMGQGKALTKRYLDIIHPPKVDERSGEEIALDVIAKLGLKVN